MPLQSYSFAADFNAMRGAGIAATTLSKRCDWPQHLQLKPPVCHMKTRYTRELADGVRETNNGQSNGSQTWQ